ncbi:expressed unknown protein [Seminavis robusta]|uniref:Uncharacterized protein n=1 Tax=Seminavis robusta TaxID=568900 RepID=A0A9N8DHV9_9STRA|nr:expressed unknown protein [Seminavis robusta]|eukprot:Sro151_g069280.1 n/a (252) ;mRNA; f:84003-84758
MTSLAPAPHRCFVMDLPSVVSRHQQEQNCHDVRLMGTVVSIKDLPPYTEEDPSLSSSFYQYGNDEYTMLELDDGTGSIICLTPMATMERLVALKVGNMIDCIGKCLRLGADTKSSTDSRASNTANSTSTYLPQQQQPTALIIQVDTLLEVRGEASVAERLRWLEITQLQPKLFRKSTTCTNAIGSMHGYPCPEMSSNDILQIIESNEREGVKLADLAMVMDIEEIHAKTLIEDLQMQGLVYENEKGCFVPL